MKIDFRRLLVGVLAGSIVARLYDSFTKRIQHEDRNLHEALVIFAILIGMLALREN